MNFENIVVIFMMGFIVAMMFLGIGHQLANEQISSKVCQKEGYDFGIYNSYEIWNNNTEGCGCYDTIRYESIKCFQSRNLVGSGDYFEINLTEPYHLYVCQDCPNTLPMIYVLVATIIVTIIGVLIACYAMPEDEPKTKKVKVRVVG